MNGKEKIIRAAFELFSEKGFAAVGIREVGSRAGLTNPAMYQHFDGKEALGLEVYRRCYDALLRAVEKQIGRQSDAVSCLNAYVDAAVKLHRQSPSPLLFLEDEQRTFSEKMKALHGQKTISAQVIKWIEDGQRSGQILSDLPASMLAASVIGQVTKWAAMSSLGLAPTRGAATHLKRMMSATLAIKHNQIVEERL